MTEFKLLDDDEPRPVTVEREGGASPFVIAVDHASNRIPRRLGDLGLSEAERRRHIAWDIGAAEVARGLAETLDAACVLQNYSRLVVDCNRSPNVTASVPVLSEATPIPGNRDLTSAELLARIREILDPYQDRIADLLDARDLTKRPSVLVALHSFTPSFLGEPRPWHIGILYNRDARLAHGLMALLAEQGDLVVGDNQPYAVSDETDYTIPVHGEQRGLIHVEIEIRQDLVADPAGQAAWVERLADLLPRALDRVVADYRSPDRAS
ncbi:MAG: N-formylglutamate amidohydrolase [Kiloniellales bacterium]|nr:N-formylglutamate amidohydrolase [Kiloniellales bacterium]